MPGEKILVVDDEKEIRELIVKYLKREGMQVSQSECGKNAIEMVETDKFDLIVLDIMMNDLDGFDVLREVRKNKPCLPTYLKSRLLLM